MGDAAGPESGRWRVVGEREVYRSPWVRVGQVDVEVPGGERVWHHVVRLHRTALLVLLDDDERVLLVWRDRFLAGQQGWELPGGLVDEDEEPTDAALRELEEETGYRAARVEHLITFRPVPGSVDAQHLVFTGRDPVRADELGDAGDAARAEWVPLRSVPAMIAAGEIWDAGSLVALLRFLMTGG